MKNVISTLLKILKALPIIVELLQVFNTKSEDTDSSSARKSDKDIIEDV